jgi:hypothetical protein
MSAVALETLAAEPGTRRSPEAARWVVSEEVSSYADATRVVRDSDTESELPSPQGWVVEYHPAAGQRRATVDNEDYHHPPYWAAAIADEAIHLIIGDPVDGADEPAHDGATTGGR